MKSDAEAGLQEEADTQQVLDLLSQDNDIEELVQAASDEELATENVEEEPDVLLTADEWKRSQRVFSPYLGARIQRAERASQAEFMGDIAGPVYSGVGDMHVHQYYSTAASVAKGVAARISFDIEQIQAVYVQPLLYSQAYAVLVDRHIIILLSQARMGKWTSALHLLQKLHANDVYQFNPNTDLETLDLPENDRQRGYLINQVPTDELANLNAFALDRLSSQLKARNSHLVIIVGGKTDLLQQDIGNYIVRWDELPDRVQMLGRHLSWHLGERKADFSVDAVIQNSEICDRLRYLQLPDIADVAARLAMAM
jgi:hypothetical protein